MKNRTKYLSAAAAVMLCGAAFAAVDDALITFSTTDDKYADESSVLDGEWYALCWCADNATFDGFKADGTLQNSKDNKIVNIRPRAKDGGCPLTVVQVSSQFVKGGSFYLCLLDTRGMNGSVADESLAAPTTINSATTVLSATVASSAASKGGTVALGRTAVATVADETVLPSDVKDPSIADFRVNGTTAEIDVADLHPSLRYKVQMGSDLNNINTYGGTLKTYGSTTATFEVNLSDAAFFKVVRQPISSTED